MNVSILSITASIGLPKPVASADTNIKSPSFISLFFFDFVTESNYFIPNSSLNILSSAFSACFLVISPVHTLSS